mgnify:CR=1 FL=1
MKRNKLPKGIIITGTLLSTMLVATGCSTVKEVIDDYNPFTQQEMLVYGPAQYYEETTEETEKTTEETEEADENTEEKKVIMQDAVCDYGIVEK